MAAATPTPVPRRPVPAPQAGAGDEQPLAEAAACGDTSG